MKREFLGFFAKIPTWYRLPLPLEKGCCSEGSPYCAWVKKGTTKDLLVHFDGSGPVLAVT